MAECIRIGDNGFAPVEPADCAHLLLIQLEVKDVDVLRDSAGIRRPWNCHQTELDVPAEYDLRRGLAMLDRDPGDHRVVPQLVARCTNRAVRLGDNAVGGVVRPALLPRRVGTQLNLVHVRRDTGLVEHALQMGRLEVGCANGAESGVFEHRLETPQCIDVAILVRVRPMHQQEIDVVDAQSLQARFVRVTDAIDAMPPAIELRGDEDLGPIDTRVPDGLSDRILIAVVLGRVDQAVAGLERRPDLSR